jgi:hypothetical protein
VIWFDKINVLIQGSRSQIERCDDPANPVIQQALREHNDIEHKTEIEIIQADTSAAKLRPDLDRGLALAWATARSSSQMLGLTAGRVGVPVVTGCTWRLPQRSGAWR